jgi:hypothetical protein
MDCLTREQLLLLQHNLTYETYEEFMSMFKKEDECIPENEEDSYIYILDVLKQHDYFGIVSGWGDDAIYINITSNLSKSSFMSEIRSSCVTSRKELIEYLDNYPHKDKLNLELQDKKKSCMRAKDSI